MTTSNAKDLLNTGIILSKEVSASIYSAVDTIVAMIGQNNKVTDDYTKLKKILNTFNGNMSIGSCKASGVNRAVNACKLALSRIFPAIEDYDKVTSVIINICGSPEMTLNEYDTMAKIILERFSNDTSFLMEVTTSVTLRNDIQVTVLVGVSIEGPVKQINNRI